MSTRIMDDNAVIVTISVVAFVAILILLLICLYVYYYKYYYPHITTTQDDTAVEEAAKPEQTIYIRLNAFEDRLLMTGGRMVSTITWYRGDHTSAALYLQERFDRLLHINPWLTGTIQRRHRWYLFGTNYLVYHQNPTSSSSSSSSSSTKEAASSSTKTTKKRISDDLFLHLTPSESPLSRYDTPMEDVSDIVRQQGLSCTPDYHGHMYRVNIVPCSKSPATHFAVIISMSHIAGDAHTYYALFNALMNFPKEGLSSTSSTVTTDGIESSSSSLDEAPNHISESGLLNYDDTMPVLSVQRVTEYPNDVKQAMHSRRDATLSVSWSFIIPSALSMIYGKIRNRCSSANQYQIQRRYIRIDPEKIHIMKQEAIQLHSSSTKSPSPPEQPIISVLHSNQGSSSSNNNTGMFCSLNDVVTSWLMMHSQCRHGFMAMNMRNRRLHQYKTTEDDDDNDDDIEQPRHVKKDGDHRELYGDTLAGNYISLVYYEIPRNCSTPILIRQSLSHLRRVELPVLKHTRCINHKKDRAYLSSPLPRSTVTTTTSTDTPCKSASLLLFGGSIVVTNWCSFRTTVTNHATNCCPRVEKSSSSVSLSTTSTINTGDDHDRPVFPPSPCIVEEEIHYPLYTYQVDTHPYNTIIAILYRESNHTIQNQNENQIGLMLCGSPSRLDGLIASCPFVGSSCTA